MKKRNGRDFNPKRSMFDLSLTTRRNTTYHTVPCFNQFRYLYKEENENDEKVREI